MSNTLVPHPAWIEINLRQLLANIKAIKAHVGNRQICLPVKANAYGHGLEDIAKATSSLVDYFGVSSLHEGARLRESGITNPILVFGAIHENQIEALLNYNLEFSLSSPFKAKLVQDLCQKMNKQAQVHLEVETGMQRTGMRPDTLFELFNHIKNNKYFSIKGIYSHLATSDQLNHDVVYKQIQMFEELVKKIKTIHHQPILFHLANSGGVCHYPESWFDMVRPGLLPYGYYPSPIAKTPLVQPCFAIKARISYFKVVEAGAGISYGHTYHPQTKTRVITIPVGYGDGYRRALSNQAHVLVGGQAYKVAGTICMDQFMVDLGWNEAYVGDEVVLIGSQGNAEIRLEDLAKMCSTIPYELLCGFNDRLPRIYLGI